jgi:hypothetical protein
MKHWFTTHWPGLLREPVEAQAGVWVPDTKIHVIDEMEPGDLVWIYESLTGSTPVDENGTRLRRRRGRMGVVVLVEVAEPPRELAGSRAERYAGRGPIWWRYYAATRPINTAGFIPLARAAEILGHPGWNLHGFGGGSGIVRISEAVHAALLSAFTAASHTDLVEAVASTLRSGSTKGGGGGEGPVHRTLKERIAADPETVLQEKGLRHVKTEMPFPTGDRIDVVLEDGLGRPVAVEVEVDCDHNELCGPLQCMKYRGILAYWLGRDPREVRMVLAAHSVHRAVADRAARAGIEIILVER